MHEKGSPPDGVVAAIAARQHGVVSTQQLNAAGITKDAIFGRLRSGRLHRIHRGVHAVGHPSLTFEGRWMAAVLASGDSAVLSHRSAAALWKLLPPTGDAVDVTVGHGARRHKRRGIRIHRSRNLTSGSRTFRRGIPVTTPARTIADLRRVVSPAQLRRAIREAEVLGLKTGLEAEIEPTRSELEHGFLRLCRRHHLPMPEVNAPIDRFLVDFLWPRHRLIAETDGYQYHRGRQAFEDDRARDTELRLMGFEVVRFTYRQVADDPARVARTLRQFLAR